MRNAALTTNRAAAAASVALRVLRPAAGSVQVYVLLEISAMRTRYRPRQLLQNSLVLGPRPCAVRCQCCLVAAALPALAAPCASAVQVHRGGSCSIQDGCAVGAQAAGKRLPALRPARAARASASAAGACRSTRSSVMSARCRPVTARGDTLHRHNMPCQLLC